MRVSLLRLIFWPTFQREYNRYSAFKYQAHSDMIRGPINHYGNVIDVMIEAKNKEKAVMGLRRPELRTKLLVESIRY